jgi:hypothetical protein
MSSYSFSFHASRILLSLFCVSISFLSCKKDDSNPINPPPPGGGGLSNEAERTVVFDSINARIDALPRVDPDVDNLTMFQYLSTHPAFEAAGILKRSVWARFRDGRIFVFVNNFSTTDIDTLGLSSTVQVYGNPSDLPRSGASGENLPTNNGARIMNSLGPHFDQFGINLMNYTQAKIDITSWLQQSGYTPVSTTPTIDQLKTVAHDGVFYWTAHGSYGIARTGDTLFGVWTSNERTEISDTNLAADLNDGSIIYFSAPHDQGILGPINKSHYAITKNFVRKYMNFGPNSLVFINACLSDDADFRAEIFNKNAGMYLGWDNFTNAQRSVRVGRFFFDRSLGANVERPAISPPQKGYQLYDVYGFMYNVGLTQTTTNQGIASLNSNPSLPSVTLLRPIIYSVHPSYDETRILGWFGEDPGQGAASVRIGSTTVPIKSNGWVGATTISCDPVNIAGEVVVSVRGRKSHPALLTKFTGNLNYTLTGPGSLQKQIQVSIEFIADVRTYRLTGIDQPPAWWLPREIYAINTTGGTYQASGEHRDNQGNLIEQWSGSGSLHH